MFSYFLYSRYAHAKAVEGSVLCLLTFTVWADAVPFLKEYTLEFDRTLMDRVRYLGEARLPV